jgi:hypothetical protein
MTGDEDHRYPDLPVAKLRHEVEAVAARHLLINDETAEPRQVAFPQQLVCTRIDADGQSLEFERELERVADGSPIGRIGRRQPARRSVGLMILPNLREAGFVRSIQLSG